MTTTITIDNVWTRIQSDNPDMIKRARRIASYEQKNWQMARKKWIERLERAGRANKTDWEFKNAVEWDGWRFIGNEGRNGNSIEIPTGCTKMFIAVAMALKEELSFSNNRTPALTLEDVDWSVKKDREPRPYQTDAITALVDNGGRGIIQSPTASGKTFMMALAIEKFRTTTLIKVPRLIILKQIYDELIDTLNIDEGEIGVIGGGKHEPSLITIATVQSLASIMRDRSRWLTLMGTHAKYGWGLLITDEVHHDGSETGQRTSMAINAYYRVGFSATALMREDGENIRIIGAFEDIIYNVPAEPLIEEGWLVKPTIKFLPVKPIYTTRSDMWPSVYNMAIVHNRERNKMIIDTANKMNNEKRSTLIFVKRIDHGDELVSLATLQANHPIRFVHASTPDREDAIDEFKNGLYPTMVATSQIISEGFDFRGLDALIVADGGKSVIQTLQKPGRGMRIEDGKTDLLVFDFADRGKYIGDHARTRRLSYIKAGFEVDISQTPYLG